MLIWHIDSENVPTEKRGVVVGIAAGIVIIYTLILVVEYFHEKRESAKMNSLLAGMRLDE